MIGGGKTVYYTGTLPLGLDDDKYWLSELQVFLRSNFAEAFAATEEDIAAPMHGRNKPIGKFFGCSCCRDKGKVFLGCLSHVVLTGPTVFFFIRSPRPSWYPVQALQK